MDIDVSELKALTADFSKIGPELIAGVRLLVQKACADTKRDAQILAPVDTGFLRSSISFETHETKAGAWGEVGPTADYGGYVEDGTSVMAPQAYMGPAFDRHAPAYVKACEQLGAKAPQ
jgi:HK97 gp10 family phage protein